ncbi:MAG: TolC family protein, partial [Kofleriaceae bacterium]|nr:TolC family protein [Kofleriaceae bacterium]
TRTGRAPEGPAPALPADTAAEAPLDTWLGDADVMPDVRAARAAHRASEVAADAAELSWIPTVTAFAAERLTNASGFGERATWSVGVTATWRLELETLRSARVADAGERVGAVRLGRAAQAARDRITDAWDLIDARRAAADAAAAQVAAAHEALDVARVRIRGGLATPLDLLGAQRDAFAADVELVQARAELAAARALLRLAAGREVTP